MLSKWKAGLLFALLALNPAPATSQDRADRRQEGAGTSRTFATSSVEANAGTVEFDNLMREGRVTALRVSIDQGSCVIERIIVSYANGQIHFEDREINLNDAGRLSKAIDPRVEGRLIERVEIRLKKGACDAGVALQVMGTQTSEMRAEAQRRRYATAKKRSIRAPTSGDTEKSADPPAASSAPVVERAKYSEVDVFFGTSREDGPARQREDVKMASFGPSPHPDGRLAVGKAVVTVPLENRQEGQINRPEYRWLSMSYEPEDINRHFTIFRVDVWDQAKFIAEAQAAKKQNGNLKDHAFVFVHGYNVSFDDALFRGAQLSFDMKFDGLAFIFAWPSRANLAGYVLDRQRASGAQRALREFVELIRQIMGTGAKNIHFIGHSMGSQPLMDALSTYDKPANSTDPLFGQVLFAASDVVRDNFRSATTRIAKVASGVTLYASSKDWALTASGIVNLFEQPVGLIKSSQPPYIGPSFDSIDVSALDTDFFARNHSTYGDRRPLIDDMLKLFSGTADAIRPPPRRSSNFEELSAPRNGGIFWRYAP